VKFGAKLNLFSESVLNFRNHLEFIAGSFNIACGMSTLLRSDKFSFSFGSLLIKYVFINFLPT
jgi:hypothetical protein